MLGGYLFITSAGLEIKKSRIRLCDKGMTGSKNQLGLSAGGRALSAVSVTIEIGTGRALHKHSGTALPP